MPKKRIAALVQVDRKTVRRYVTLATEQGLTPAPGGAITPTDEQLAAVLLALKRDTGRSHGESWARCVEHRAFIEEAGTLAERRARNLRCEVPGIATARMRRRLERVVSEDPATAELMERVVRRELDPASAAVELLEKHTDV